ncbi:MAG: membrane integrity-associated transporter subunit PqiC [Jhaorihella sp.]
MIRNAVVAGAIAAGTALGGCAGNSARFLIDPPAAETRIRVPVATIELRNVSLPGYAAALEIAQQDRDGALYNIPDVLWADDPVRGITVALARSLDQATTATAAAEPWPLAEPAQARVEVRVERMLARSDDNFEFSGQYAIAAPDGAVRERLVRFDILLPLAARDPQTIAAASSRAVSALAVEIAKTLAH